MIWRSAKRRWGDTMNVGVNYIPVSRRYAVERLTGIGYVVMDPEGQVVAGSQTQVKAKAAEQCQALQRAADQKAKRGERPCICCHRPFFSEGIHNRMCWSCRQQSNALADEARPALPRARGGRS